MGGRANTPVHPASPPHHLNYLLAKVSHPVLRCKSRHIKWGGGAAPGKKALDAPPYWLAAGNSQDGAARGKGDLSARAREVAASSSAAGSQWDVVPSCQSVSTAGAGRDQARKATVASVPAVKASSTLSFEARGRLGPWLGALSSSLLFRQTCCGDQKHQEAQGRRRQGAGAALETLSH